MSALRSTHEVGCMATSFTLTSSGATPVRAFACPFARGASIGLGDSTAMLMKLGERGELVVAHREGDAQGV